MPSLNKFEKSIEKISEIFNEKIANNGDADKILDQLRVRRFICILTKTASVL